MRAAGGGGPYGGERRAADSRPCGSNGGLPICGRGLPLPVFSQRRAVLGGSQKSLPSAEGRCPSAHTGAEGFSFALIWGNPHPLRGSPLLRKGAFFIVGQAPPLRYFPPFFPKTNHDQPSTFLQFRIPHSEFRIFCLQAVEKMLNCKMRKKGAFPGFHKKYDAWR